MPIAYLKNQNLLSECRFNFVELTIGIGIMIGTERYLLPEYFRRSQWTSPFPALLVLRQNLLQEINFILKTKQWDVSHWTDISQHFAWFKTSEVVAKNVPWKHRMLCFSMKLIS